MKKKLFKQVFSMLMVCLLAVTSIPLTSISLTASANSIIYNAEGNSSAGAGVHSDAPTGYEDYNGGYRFAVVAAKDGTTINGKTYNAGEVVSDEDGVPMICDFVSHEIYSHVEGIRKATDEVVYNKVRTSKDTQNFKTSDIDLQYIPEGMPYPTRWTGKAFVSDGNAVREWLVDKYSKENPNLKNLSYILLKSFGTEAVDLMNSGSCKVVMEPTMFIPLYSDYVSKGYVRTNNQKTVPTSSGKESVYTLNPNYSYRYSDENKMERLIKGGGKNDRVEVAPDAGFFGRGYSSNGVTIAVDYEEYDPIDSEYYPAGRLTKENATSYTGHTYYGTAYGYLKACYDFKDMFKDKVICKKLYPDGISGDGTTFMSPLKNAIPCGFHLARDDKEFGLYKPANPDVGQTWSSIGNYGYGIHIYESTPQTSIIHTYDIINNPKDPAPAEPPTDEKKNKGDPIKGDITIVKLYMNAWKDKSGSYMGLEPAQPNAVFTQSHTTNSIVVSDETGDNKPGYNVVSWYVSTEAPKTDLKISDWVQFTKGEKALKDVLAIPGINGKNGTNGLFATQYYPVSGVKNGVNASSLSTGNYDEKAKK